ncbi:MAG: apolipoprotein A1/A4/E family protein [Candidatus Obscuribacterales bacterium]|nr:apolipoprotein A1/A4/E family protein [Candidatus Obscuribacterales bacterium]
MPEEDKDQNLNSALNLWQEGVDQAADDLEKIVNNSIEQLIRYSEELEKSLDQQLKKIATQTSSMVDSNVEELSAKRDEVIEQIAEFERNEADEILRTAQDAREKIYKLVESTKQVLSRRLTEAVKKLNGSAENPRQRFTNFTQKNRDAMTEYAESARDKLSAQKVGFETSLTTRSKELDLQSEGAVSASKQSVDKKLFEYEAGFDEKIAQVLSQLDELLIATTKSAEQASSDGASELEACRVENSEFLNHQIMDWKSNIESLKHDFQEDLESNREETLAIQSRRLNYTVSEAKSSINQVANDALARITGNHRMYYGSLKRLERKYEDQVSRLINRLESVLSEEHELAGANLAQSTDDVKQKLKSQLKARGGELVKTYRRQVDQMEGDFARASASSYERIDSIRLQAVESLEKQVRIIRSELDRVEKSFKTELSQLSIELPEIEERGRVAAMSVSAYLASMLTLDAD